ncbi:uncharacterized protein [Argopecten irradians]|uniref:uncharacterized protein isoform X2 n=1 Tax=Argopecten irradians TaxID=31199 RepID=UPI0037118709
MSGVPVHLPVSIEIKTYFHHTTLDGLSKILQSGYIKQSTITTNDAVYGAGTYLTSYGPEKSQWDVAINNYDGCKNKFAEQMLKSGKTDAIIAVDLPTSSVTKPDPYRDIYVYPEDIIIAGKNPRFYVRNKDGTATEISPAEILKLVP